MTKNKKLVIVSILIFAVFGTMTACKSSDTAGNTEPESIVKIAPTTPPATVPVTKTSLIVDGATAKAGDNNVEVVIRLEKNPGILGVDFDLYYDDSVMNLVNAISELNMEGCVYTPPAYYRNPTSFLWDFQDLNWTEDGNVLKLYFDISDTAPAGEYEVKIMYSYGNIFDANFEPIDVGVRNGNISVC